MTDTAEVKFRGGVKARIGLMADYMPKLVVE